MAQPRPRKLIQKSFIRFLVAPPAADAETLLADTHVNDPEGPSLPEKILAAFREVDEDTAAAKRKLDPYEDDRELPGALRAVDMYVGLKRTIMRHYGGQIVTNAWLKMHEMATQLGLVEAARTFTSSGPVLRAFCNAELPGAFVSALNHLTCTWFPDTRFEWVASSLYPEEASTERTDAADTLGDFYGLYAHNRDRWLMGPDMVGDVTNAKCIRELARRAREKLGEVDFYTSDVGTDVSEDYARQEELTARLNLGQIVTGLLALRVGGVFVVKTYTFVHPYSLAVAGVCAALFDSFYVTKPKTSRAANSEVYFVGIGYHGAPDAVTDALLEAVTDFDFSRPLFPVGLPEVEHTVLSLLVAARQIHRVQQVAFLEETVQLYESHRKNVKALRGRLEGAARAAQKQWLRENPVGALKEECRLSAKS